MRRFRKKHIEIEAHQWFKNGDHPEDYVKDQIDPDDNGDLILNGVRCKNYTGAYRKEQGWEGDIVRYFRHPDVSGTQPCRHCGQTMHVHGWIDTHEDGHNVCPGDWIIKEDGDYYPCKPDEFERKFEEVVNNGVYPYNVEMR